MELSGQCTAYELQGSRPTLSDKAQDQQGNQHSFSNTREGVAKFCPFNLCKCNQEQDKFC